MVRELTLRQVGGSIGAAGQLTEAHLAGWVRHHLAKLA